MARGCHKCTGNLHEGFMWMTIRSNSPSVSAVTPSGQIVPLVIHNKMSNVEENSIGVLSRINATREESDIKIGKSKVIKEESQTKIPNPFTT